MKIPSDFAVARSSENWFSMAQDYYFATKVLRQSYLQARIDIKSVTVFDEKGTEVLAKTQILNPLLLLMGHCIELQVKSLCIKIKGDELITPLKNAITHHKTVSLCEQCDIDLNDDEKYLLNLLHDCVVFGKYPTDKVQVKKHQVNDKDTPDKKHSIHPQTLCHIDELYPAFDLFYKRLSGLYDSKSAEIEVD